MLIGAGAAKLEWLQKANHHRKKWILVLDHFLADRIASKNASIVILNHL